MLFYFAIFSRLFYLLNSNYQHLAANTPTVPGHYSIEGVSDTLEENYNKGTTRTTMGGGEHRKECICACVALNWHEQQLETFDTHNARYKDWDLIQFLTASSDAPVYFTTPYTVKGNSTFF